MNTKKRLLALILVLAMAATMVPFAMAEDDIFSDYDDVKNKEAVSVLTGIDVIRGLPGGIFGPDEFIDRAQAAVIIARMMLGPAFADSLPSAVSGFVDVDNVPGLGYASGAIAYCVSQGYVIGVGGNRFNPTGTLTPVQFAAMLLRVLGYGQNNEFAGAGWDIRVLALANNVGLFAGITADWTANAPRNDIAQYAFNALDVPMVSFDKNTGQYVRINTSGIPTVSSPKLLMDNFPDLNPEFDRTSDDLGRPIRVWFVRSNDIFRGVMTPVTVFEGEVEQNDLFAATALGRDLPDATTTAVINSEAGRSPQFSLIALRNEDATAGIPGRNAGNKNGIRTELYDVTVNPATPRFHAVIINPIYDDEADIGDKDVVLLGAVKDEPALYYEGKDLKYWEGVTSSRGVLTVVSNDGQKATINGSALDVAAARRATRDSFSPSNDTQTIYKDSFGYVLDVVADKAEDDVTGVVYVASVVQRLKIADNVVEFEYYATIIDNAGEEKEVLAKFTPATGAGVVQVNALRTFIIKDGAYEFDADFATRTGDWAISNNITAVTDAGTSNLTGAGALVTTATSATKFIMVEYDNNGNYKGFQELTRSALPTFTAQPAVFRAISLGENPNTIANVVYMYGAYTLADEAKELIFVIGNNRHQIVGGWSIDVIEGGQKLVGADSTVIVNQANAIGAASPSSLTLYKSLTVNSAGVITARQTALDASVAGPSNGANEVVRYDTAGQKITTSGNVFLQPAANPTVAYSVMKDAVLYVIEIDDKLQDAKVDVRTSLNYEMKAGDVAYVIYNSASEVSGIYILVRGATAGN